MPKQKTPAPSLGAELKRRREALGLRADDLASAAGLTHTTIYNYEAGKRSPTVDVLRRLAAALGCEPADLLG